LGLDASVALAWCFEDAQTEAVMGLLERVADTGAMAAALWPLEVLNARFAAERRWRVDGARRARLAGLLQELPIRLDTETADRAWQATARLAEPFGLTGYGAAYLELAQRRGLPLASLDQDLRRAAMTIGMAVLGEG
jgi:predicted nucleic acid-binding protein